MKFQEVVLPNYTAAYNGLGFLWLCWRWQWWQVSSASACRPAHSRPRAARQPAFLLTELVSSSSKTVELGRVGFDGKHLVHAIQHRTHAREARD